MPNNPQIPPKRIDILAYPDVQLLDVSGPYQVFATANRFAREDHIPPRYDLHLIAESPGLVRSSAGLALEAHPLPDAATPLDTLLIAGGEGVHAACDNQAILAWIVARSANARRTGSVCSGAFLLAAAGLLNGRRATTHWQDCPNLAARYPAIHVEPDAIYLTDGPIWTSAGVTAGIDMALALVEADHGRTLATRIARQLVVFARRPGGQAQFSAGLALAGTDDRFDQLHAWMRANLRAPLPVPVLADRAGMSERSFLRRYREVTGVTPARAVERIRVEAARQALGATATPVKRIARDCGFGSEESMRRSFLRHLAVPPQAYRDRFPV